MADQLDVGLNAQLESVDDERVLASLRIGSGSSAFLFVVKYFRNYFVLLNFFSLTTIEISSLTTKSRDGFAALVL